MATQKQIEANRLNSQKSTGPSSLAGRAAVRFNALKTGIHAQSQVIPGEDPAALELLAAEYHDRYRPATPEVRALVDTLVTAEWLQRRFRTLEARLWEHIIRNTRNPDKGLEVAQTYDDHSEVFHRLQRRIDAVERTFHRALAALQKIESLAPQPGERSEPPSPDPDPQERRVPRPAPAGVPARGPSEVAQPPEPSPDESLNSGIGFVSSTVPAPPNSAVVQPAPAHEIPM